MVLPHRNNSVGGLTDMSLHYDISGFRANHALLFLPNDACLSGKHHYQFYSFLFDPTLARTTVCRSRCEHYDPYLLSGCDLIEEKKKLLLESKIIYLSCVTIYLQCLLIIKSLSFRFQLTANDIHIIVKDAYNCNTRYLFTVKMKNFKQ